MGITKKAGVVGFPVAHSLSPRLHGFWLKKYNIAGEYKAYEVKPEDLASFVNNMRGDKDFVGVNITIPHKEAVVKLLDNADSVSLINAVNTIVVRDNKLVGLNTDAYGFAENIKSNITGKNKAVVLGAGGAAKAAIFALEELGFEQIIVTNRTRERAERLASNLPNYLSGNQIITENNIGIADWENRSKILEDADLLVNTTSLGMTGKEQLEIDLSLLPKTALVTDIVYSPIETPLLAKARARGNPTVDGLGMLLHQAVPAFEAWFAKELDGRKPEVDEQLRQYVLSGIKS